MPTDALVDVVRIDGDDGASDVAEEIHGNDGEIHSDDGVSDVEEDTATASTGVPNEDPCSDGDGSWREMSPGACSWE